MAFVGRWCVECIAVICAINLVPGIIAVGGPWVGPLMCALVLSLINVSIKPVLQTLGLPVSIITLGIFSLFINAGLLELASWLSRNLLGAGIYIESFGAAVFGSVIISLVGMVLSALTGVRR